MPDLDGLIDHLLDRVALTGDAGAVLSDLNSWIESYYAHDAATEHRNGAESEHKVDDLFCRTVWGWLTLQKGLTLEHRPARLSQIDPDDEDVAESRDPATALTPTLLAPEEHIWRALTGHGPDPKKVPPLLLQLLSIIAAHGPEGISQPTLVQVSGQDKRSVPKRTDTLHQHGYIDKRSIVDRDRHILTSQCVLKKFIASKDQPRISWDDMDPPTLNQTLFPTGKSTNLLLFLDFILSTVRDRPYVPAEELRRRLDLRTKIFQRSLLLRVLQRLENVGVITMGRVPVIRKRNKETLIPAIQFLREPSQEERANFGRFSQRLDAEGDDNEHDPADSDIDDSVDGSDVDMVDSQTHDSAFSQKPTSDGAGSWQPDALIQNQVFEMIHNAGPSGIGSSTAHTSLGWQLYKKPFEIISNRLNAGSKKQPSNLQHLTIVRDVTLNGRNRQYVFRSSPQMNVAVESGEASWKAVGGLPKPSKSPRLDKWGFGVVDRNLLSRKALGKAKAQRHSSAAAIASDSPGLSVSAEPADTFEKAVLAPPVSASKKGTVPAKRSLHTPAETHGSAIKRTRISEQSTGQNSPTQGWLQSPYGSIQEQPSSAYDEGNPNPRRRERPDGAGSKLEQGVHINPPLSKGFRTGRRGRPSSRKYVVFKLKRLQELPWFGAPPAEPSSLAQEVRREAQSLSTSGVPQDSSLAFKPAIDVSPQHRSTPSTSTASPHVTEASSAVRAGNEPASGSSTFFTSGHRPDSNTADSPKSPYLYRAALSGSKSGNIKRHAIALNSFTEIQDLSRNPKQRGRRNSVATSTTPPAKLIIHDGNDPQQQLRSPEEAMKHDKDVWAPSDEAMTVDDIVAPDAQTRSANHDHFPLRNEISQQTSDWEQQLQINGGPHGACSASPSASNGQRSNAERNPSSNLKTRERLSQSQCELDHTSRAERSLAPKLQKVRAGLSRNIADEHEAPRQPETQNSSASHYQTSNQAPSAAGAFESMETRKARQQKTSSGSSEPEVTAPLPLQHGNNDRDSQDGQQQRSVEQSTVQSPAKANVHAGQPNALGQQAIKDGGQISHERYAIVLEILSATEGVYPGGKEIWWAYASALRRKKGPKAVMPDQTTINRTLKTLCTAGTLRMVRFNHTTRSRTNIQMKVVALASVLEGDERLKRLEMQMRECYPGACFPAGFEIDLELKAKAGRHLTYEGVKRQPAVQNVMWSKVLQPKPRVETRAPADAEPAWKRWCRENMPDIQPSDNENEEGQPGQEETKLRAAFNLSTDKAGRGKRKHTQLTPPSTKRLKPLTDKILAPSLRKSTAQGSSLLSRKAALEDGHIFLTKIRALNGPRPIFHIPSGTYSSIYEVRIPHWRVAPMRIDTAAPARFEAALPQSLEQIVESQSSISRGSAKQRKSDVFREIEQVARWEKDNAELLTQEKQLAQPRFINHVGGFDGRLNSAVHWNPEDLAVPSTEPWQGQEVLQNQHAPTGTMDGPEDSHCAATVGRSQLPAKYNRVRRPFQQAPPLSHIPPKQPAMTAVERHQPVAVGPSNAPDQRYQQQQHEGVLEHAEKGAIPRGAGLSSILTEDEIQRIIVVVTATRIIAGGRTRHPDWTLIGKYIKFDLKGHTIPTLWKRVSVSRKKQIQALEDPFPEAYLNAYQQGEVVSVNYDDLAASNWENVFTWASERISNWRDIYVVSEAARGSQEVPQPAVAQVRKKSALPPTRAVLERSFVCELTDSGFDLDEIYNPRAPDVKVRAAQVNCPFHLPVRNKPQQDGDELAVASSILRAYLNTPWEDMEAQAVKGAFSPLPETTFQRALRELEADGTIEPAKGRTLPKFRTFDDVNLLLRKSITLGTSERFQRAIRYKLDLDHAFENLQPGDKVRFSYFAEDADVLVATNLAAMGMVRIKLDIPRSTSSDAVPEFTDATDPAEITYPKSISIWGSQMSSTRAAKVDSSGLVFQALIEPTPAYQYGLPPLDEWDWDAPTRPATSGEFKHAIPAWCDIEGNVFNDVWQTSVVGLVCYLASRPSSTAKSIARAWGKASSMQEWEIELALNWLQERGMVKQVGQGRWANDGWWWCLFGESGWSVGKSKTKTGNEGDE